MVPLQPFRDPVFVPLSGVSRRHEELQLHLLELTCPEHEVAGRNLVAEALAHLGDTERRLLAGGVQHVGKVHEHALSRLGTQVALRSVLSHRTGVRLEHEVESPRLGEGVLLAARRTGGAVGQLILAKPLVAVLAIHQRVGEVGDVTRGFVDGRRTEDGRVDQHHVVALLHHRPDPGVFHVAQHERTERAVVVGGPKTAVDLRRRIHEPAALGQVHDAVDQVRELLRHKLTILGALAAPSDTGPQHPGRAAIGEGFVSRCPRGCR